MPIFFRKPTRITNRPTNATLPYDIWTNVISFQSIKSGILTYEISDHLPILLSLIDFKYKRCFSDTNMSKFNSLIESLDTAAVLSERDSNLSFKLFMNLYNAEFNRCNGFPLVRVKENKKVAPWFDTELQTLLLKQKNYLRFTCIKRPPTQFVK